jgi:hypothetical protein
LTSLCVLINVNPVTPVAELQYIHRACLKLR